MPALSSYPLNDIAKQWQRFIQLAETTEAFRVSGLVLSALACEASAQTVSTGAWSDYEQDHDGKLLCYALCEVLNQLIDAGTAWRSVVTYLEAQRDAASDEYVQDLANASAHDYQRVSFLHLSVQAELQGIAHQHKVPLIIGVVEGEEIDQ